MLMQVTPNIGPEPRTDISGKELLEPITHAIEVTLPTPAISLYNHSYTYLIHPSIAYAIAASQRFASRHETGSRLIRYERRPTEV